MKATEFAYWLQGYFEIDGNDKPLSNAQAKKVLERAKSAKSDGGAVDNKAQSFADYTAGALFPVTIEDQSEKFLGTITRELKSKLNDLFIHAIDPAIPGDQTQFRNTHRPDGPKRGGLEAMC
jgi:hypothetical protein